MDRDVNITDITHLVGSIVHITGKIIKIVDNNPFTKAIRPSRQRRFLVKPVNIAGINFDHLWIPSYKSVYKKFKLGDTISLTAKLVIYVWKDVNRYAVKSPYNHIEICN